MLVCGYHEVRFLGGVGLLYNFSQNCVCILSLLYVSVYDVPSSSVIHALLPSCPVTIFLKKSLGLLMKLLLRLAMALRIYSVFAVWAMCL